MSPVLVECVKKRFGLARFGSTESDVHVLYISIYIYYICIHYLDHDLTYLVTPVSVFRITPLSKLYVLSVQSKVMQFGPIKPNPVQFSPDQFQFNPLHVGPMQYYYKSGFEILAQGSPIQWSLPLLAWPLAPLKVFLKRRRKKKRSQLVLLVWFCIIWYGILLG